jgi:hypothetical protein
MSRMIYLFSGGGFVTAASPAEFLGKMRRSSLFGRQEDDQTFMDSVADRCHLDSAACIRTDTAAHFLHDLVAHEYVIAINPN